MRSQPKRERRKTVPHGTSTPGGGLYGLGHHVRKGCLQRLSSTPQGHQAKEERIQDKFSQMPVGIAYAHGCYPRCLKCIPGALEEQVSTSRGFALLFGVKLMMFSRWSGWVVTS